MNYLWEYKNKTKPRSISQIIKILAENRNLLSECLIPPKPELLISQIVSEIQLRKMAQLVMRHSSNKVLIYGDYDVDGVCSTAIISSSLSNLGINHLTYIPDRRTDGYGLNQFRLKTLMSNNPEVRLLITVDNGVSASSAIMEAIDTGIEVGVIDHHHMPEIAPNYNVLIHSPDTSASVLAWCLASYLEVANDNSLSLACLGMIADVIPLTGFNRSIAYHGLMKINESANIGITSLLETAGLSSKKIDTGHIGFQIAPRINAPGRISNATLSLELLLSKDKHLAYGIASRLSELNTRRQLLTQSALDQVTAEEVSNFPLIICHNKEFDEGVIGLVAAKLVEKYYKPAIVLSVGKEISKASVRSHSQINIIEFLNNASSHYIAIGGHPQAAGFSVKTELLPLLISDLRKSSNIWDKTPFSPSLKIDCLLSPELISLELLNSIDQLSPFGVGNPKPIFSLTGICKQVSRTGREKKHLSGYISSDSINLKFIAFNWENEDPIKDQIIEIACQLSINEWQGQISIELVLKDWRQIKNVIN